MGIATWPSFFPSSDTQTRRTALGDARLAEFFEFQLITRCKRERREIYVPRFVRRDASRDLGFRCTEQLRNISNCESAAEMQSARALGSGSNERRYVFISHTRISVRTEFRKLRGPCSCQLTDISRLGFPFFIDVKKTYERGMYIEVLFKFIPALALSARQSSTSI